MEKKVSTIYLFSRFNMSFQGIFYIQNSVQESFESTKCGSQLFFTLSQGFQILKLGNYVTRTPLGGENG